MTAVEPVVAPIHWLTDDYEARSAVGYLLRAGLEAAHP